MYAALTIVAVILAIVGIWALLTGSIITGIILLVLAVLVGPGGYSIAGGRRV
ncbi:MAG TPA: GPGG-motif small membrane protein [Acidimicrobiia bacterium]|nr:GPGG-motif small membrane protein [Acidimicrobiia bacterium]